MTSIEVGAGIWVHDPGYGGSFPLDEPAPVETPHALATQYFEETGTVVSPTTDAQRWRVPNTESYIPAASARELSLEVRRRLGRPAL